MKEVYLKRRMKESPSFVCLVLRILMSDFKVNNSTLKTFSPERKPGVVSSLPLVSFWLLAHVAQRIINRQGREQGREDVKFTLICHQLVTQPSLEYCKV